VEKTPWGLKIRMTASALHTPRIETEVLLPEDVKRIELCNLVQVDLLYAKQACYFAFPWALSGPTFRYDIANGFVDPERDLLEGACSEWFCVQHWVRPATIEVKA
jgi:alpha-mannosidase